ncbi:MAG: metallophosphoesterase [Candidatus Bathyarchaeota archaeon]|nr:MAG: metallophosphoesterase [Candidatus Bathyarchaeota archaeon]
MLQLKPIRSFPAILLQEKAKRVLVVADLHIGWETALIEKGIHVPSQTPKILTKMLRLIKLVRPTNLIFLGDVKHAVSKVKMKEWQDIPSLFETLYKKVPNIQVIPGNHDGNLEALLPQDVEILSAKGTALGEVGLFHGHAWPAPELLQCRTLITGHIHPMVAFRDPLGFRISRQVWVRARCHKAQLARSLLKHLGIKADNDSVALLERQFNVRTGAAHFFIMPSFNHFLGGQTVNKKRMRKDVRTRGFIGPMLRSRSVNIDGAELFLLDGTFIGTVEQLRPLS